MTTPAYDASDLTIVIPTRDRWQILGRTLDALQTQTVSGFETVVVVDGEDQQPPDLGTALVVVVPHGGPGAARNAGVAATSRPLVLFLGDDMVPDRDLVERHVAAHNREPAPEVAVLGLAVWHDEVAQGAPQRFLDWSHLQFDYRNIVGDDAGWGRFYSCNVSLKRKFYEAAGGFDPDFTYFYEDLDAGYRLHEQGLILRYEPAAVTRHLHAYDWPGLTRRFTGIARGEHLMARKHEWFTPWFRPKMQEAAASRPSRLPWERAAGALPARLDSVTMPRITARQLSSIAPAFLDVWEGERDLVELQEYLGDEFDLSKLQGHVLEVEREEEDSTDERTFYRTSRAYLYDLTVFAMSGTKLPYRQALHSVLPPGSRLLDYGCGIGADGLRLIEAGYRVDFADFANPSTEYLRWRLERRGASAQIFDIEDSVPGGYDGVYCFDVIEHVEDPFAFLKELESRGSVVAVNFLEPDPNDTHVHHDLPVAALVAHARSRGLLHYRRYHGRSHLVIYGRPPRTASFRGRVKRRAEAARSTIAARRVSN